ncbi:hypothetical protein N7493_008172 [Penicillium malachiteum]|uniref:Uncharacterized protein n=1 Tax=Penicillium malachiteum TaxID=1324776 RepID=A0AAD6MTJ3_9EURO|nr:hypothetical protein N7493_008172 [Penicillium malachiteum]
MFVVGRNRQFDFDSWKDKTRWSKMVGAGRKSQCDSVQSKRKDLAQGDSAGAASPSRKERMIDVREKSQSDLA